MSKPLSKDKTIEALREANAALAADVAGLSEAVGDLEGEVVTAKGEALEALRLADARVAEALAKAAGDAGSTLADELEKTREALRWAEGARDEAEALMERSGAEYRSRIEALETEADNLREAHKEEIDDLEEKHEAALKTALEEANSDAEIEMDTLRSALDGYLADLGYPRDPHPSTISCPNLRRLVQALA